MGTLVPYLSCEEVAEQLLALTVESRALAAVTEMAAASAASAANRIVRGGIALSLCFYFQQVS
jgi:hypothetical protein